MADCSLVEATTILATAVTQVTLVTTAITVLDRYLAGINASTKDRSLVLAVWRLDLKMSTTVLSRIANSNPNNIHVVIHHEYRVIAVSKNRQPHVWQANRPC